MLPSSAPQRKRKLWFWNFPFRPRQNFQGGVSACFGRIHDLESEKHQTSIPPCKLISRAGFALIYKEINFLKLATLDKIH